jgi:Tfp pilus assembly protein PilF
MRRHRLQRLRIAAAAGALLLAARAGARVFLIDGLQADDMKSGDDPFAVSSLNLTIPHGISERGAAEAERGRGGSYAVSEKWRLANRHLSENRLDAALRELQRGIKFDPYNPTLLRMAAAVASAAGDLDAADLYYARYLERAPHDAPYLVGWAAVLLRQNRLREARHALDRALAAQPGYLAARFNLLCVRVKTGEDIEDLREWRGANPAELLQIAGWLAVNRDKYESLLGSNGVTRLCALMFGLPAADAMPATAGLLNAADQAARTGDWAGAVRAYGRLIGLGIRNYTVDRQHVRCLLLADDPQALLWAGRLAQQHPAEVEAWAYYGYAALASGNYSLAETAFVRALQMEPRMPQANLGLAAAFAGRGDMERAWPLLEQLARWYPRELPAWMQGSNLPAMQAILRHPGFPAFVKRIGANSKVPPPDANEPP